MPLTIQFVVGVFMAINHCNMFARLSFIIREFVREHGDNSQGGMHNNSNNRVYTSGLLGISTFLTLPVVGSHISLCHIHTHTLSKLLHLISGVRWMKI